MKRGRAGKLFFVEHNKDYTLTAKDPKQHGLRGFSVWDPTVWDPTVPRPTDFGSDPPLTDWDPTV